MVLFHESHRNLSPYSRCLSLTFLFSWRIMFPWHRTYWGISAGRVSIKLDLHKSYDSTKMLVGSLVELLFVSQVQCSQYLWMVDLWGWFFLAIGGDWDKGSFSLYCASEDGLNWQLKGILISAEKANQWVVFNICQTSGIQLQLPRKDLWLFYIK